jgi:adenylate cyclase
VLLLGVGAWMTGLVLLAYATDSLQSQELNSIRTRFSIRGHQAPPKDVVLIEVDDTTFSSLPQYQWPYPRQLHAKVIDRIVEDHPKAIGFDIQFTEIPRDPSENVRLAESIYGATTGGVPVVLNTSETDSSGGTRILGGDAGLLRSIGARPASALSPLEPDGAIRRVAYDFGKLKTFAVVMTEAADHHPVKPSLFDGSPAWIDFSGRAGTIPSIPYASVLGNHVPPGFFTGKIVLVGVSATSLQDLHATSVGPSMPGVEVQANAMQTVRRALPLRSAPTWLDVALVLVLGLAAPVASLRLLPLRALGLALLLGGAFVLACQLAFDAGLIIAFVYPLAALLLSASGSLAVAAASVKTIE